MKPHDISPEVLHRWLCQLWTAAGSDEREARQIADHLVAANLTGHDSHGIGMVPRYIKAWKVGELRLNQQPTVLQDTGAILSLDAHGAMGQAVGVTSMDMAIERARKNGVCVMGLRNAHHLGRIGHWAEQACAAGMISIHFVNVLAAAAVAPFGGSQPRYGTNPFTIGMPVDGAEPIVLDFATSAIAMGKVRVAMNKGVQAPEGCLLDANGVPTTDPTVLFPENNGPMGALRAFGEHKGYALAVMCELMAGAITGGNTIRPDTLKHQFAVWNNMFTIVIDPKALADGVSANGEIQAFVDWLRTSELMQGHTKIRLPGEPERERRAERAQAIAVDQATLDELDQAAETLKEAGKASPGRLSSLVSQ